MRIWYVPPSYMDSNSILEEVNFIFKFFGKLETSDQSLYPEYINQRGYLYLRLVMLETEYSRREPSYGTPCYQLFNSNDYTLVEKPTQDIIWSSVKKLLLHWESIISRDNILQFYDVLNSKSAEDIYLEAEWLVELYRKEFGL